MVHRILDTNHVSPLFQNWEETMIWSCIQGIMGEIYADDLLHPTAAMAVIGDFTFFAGKPTIELVAYQPTRCKQNFRILIPQNKHWQTIITQCYQEKANIVTRYATKKEPTIFDKEKLELVIASLPKSYTLSMIDKQLYNMCKTETWSADLVSQFSDYKHYRTFGIGAVICKNGRIVSGASSYSRYQEGIEIEIDTKAEYRRKGLAYICGAKLIYECLKKNLYPSWDAQNQASLALAKKLGYHYSHTYTSIEITG